MDYDIDFDDSLLVCRDCKHLWKPDNDNIDIFNLKCPLCKSVKVARQPDYSKIPVDEDGVYIREENNIYDDLIEEYDDW